MSTPPRSSLLSMAVRALYGFAFSGVYWLTVGVPSGWRYFALLVSVAVIVESVAKAERMNTTPRPSLLDAYLRLREWSNDDLHVTRSARAHEPVYANPAGLRRDVRAVLDALALAADEGQWDKFLEAINGF